MHTTNSKSSPTSTSKSHPTTPPTPSSPSRPAPRTSPSSATSASPPPKTPSPGPSPPFCGATSSPSPQSFYIPGNHEAYHSKWDDVALFFARFQSGLASFRSEQEASGSAVGEFIYLQKGRYDFSEDAVTVLGCTLFSRIPSGEFQQLGLGLNDFHLTTSWTPRQHARAHEEHLGWLNGQVRELEGSGRKVVVFTHYAPTKDERTVEERHWGSVLQSGFSTDLSGEACWTAGEVTVWAFGHTHFNCDFVDGLGKKVVTNQKGYDFQGRGTAGWDPEKVVEV